MESPYVASPDTAKEATTISHQSPYVYQSGLEVAPDPPPAASYGYYKEATSYPAPSDDRPKTILGLRRPTFFLLVALWIVVIAAAVGGGVGGSMAVNNARNSATCAISTPVSGAGAASAVTFTATVAGNCKPTSTGTGTATATSSGIVAPTGLLALDCPGLNSQGSQIITLGTTSWRFKPECGTDHPGNDIGVIIAYSFHDCLQACAAHNHFAGKDECVAVHFEADMLKAIPTNFGNCWLKTGNTATAHSGGDTDVAATLVSSG